MEKMFVSLCSIVEGSENDQLKRNRKEQEKSVLAEKIRQEKEELLMMLEREREIENMKYKVNAMSENFKLKMQKSKESRLSSLRRRSKSGKDERIVKRVETPTQRRPGPRWTPCRGSRACSPTPAGTSGSLTTGGGHRR